MTLFPYTTLFRSIKYEETSTSKSPRISRIEKVTAKGRKRPQKAEYRTRKARTLSKSRIHKPTIIARMNTNSITVCKSLPNTEKRKQPDQDNPISPAEVKKQTRYQS